jgi:uncharacterized repeat protein (TIGR03803 family)
LGSFALVALLALFCFAVHAGAQGAIPDQRGRSPELRAKTGKTHKAKAADANFPNYEVLYSFCSAGGTSCTDGESPQAGLIEDTAGNLYGTTDSGGTNGFGTVFEVDNGGNETVLYSFCSAANCTDGGRPAAGLIEDTAGNLYGTTSLGGTNSGGTVFKVNSTGNETVLYSFCSAANCTDGQAPSGGLIEDSAGNLYGTTSGGGAHNNSGTVFKVDSTGKETVLYSFCSVGSTHCTDGQYPSAGLIQDAAGNLYGTTSYGGANTSINTAVGAVFKLTPPAQPEGTWTETVLYSFCSVGSYPSCPDGMQPKAGLIQDAAGNLYGTTFYGGANDAGTVFKVDSTGKETVLYSFCSFVGSDCMDGSYPIAGLIQDGAGNLYGTTAGGGANNAVYGGGGTVFKVGGAGQEMVLYSFCSAANCTDGQSPSGGLIEDTAGNLYGTTWDGGVNGGGTVFRLATSVTTTTLASSPNPSSYNQPVIFTATVSGTNGIPTGSVTFYNGTTSLGTGTLTSGIATFNPSTSALPVGSNSITGVYSGDSNNAGSTSPAAIQTVNKASPIVTLSCSPNPAAVGQSVTCTVAASGQYGGTPTGNVTFYNGTEMLATRPLGGGTASYSTTSLTAGTHSITAVYSGDSNFNGGTSPVVSLVVDGGTIVTTKTALTSSKNPSLLGASVTFIATVTAKSGTAAGMVAFYDGTTQLGTGTLNSSNEATYSTSTLTPGSHTIEAAYAGNSEFKASSKTLTQKVEETTTTTLTYSPNPPVEGQAVSFTATITATSGIPTGSVKFYNGATLLDTATLNSSGAATYSTSTLTAGKHTIKATYVATAPFEASSASVKLTIP